MVILQLYLFDISEDQNGSTMTLSNTFLKNLRGEKELAMILCSKSFVRQENHQGQR